MKNNFLQEIFVSSAIIILLLLFLNPLGFWMPDTVLMMLVVFLIMSFALFSAFIWKEGAKDEREIMHRMLAGRIAYLVGAGVLVLGIITQSLMHKIDPWLVITLALMILAKIAGVAYGRITN